MSEVVKATLAQMAGEDSDETRGWDAGMSFAQALKKGVQHQIDFMRRCGDSEAYIDAWKDAAQSIFYTLTDDLK